MLQNISMLLQEDADINSEFMALFPAHATHATTPASTGAELPVLGALNGGPPVAHAASTAATPPASIPKPVNGEGHGEKENASRELNGSTPA